MDSSAATLITRYNRFNGKTLNVSTLKAFHQDVQCFLDSVGGGPYVSDLKGIYERTTTALKEAAGYDVIDRIELTPIDLNKTNGRILRVASGYKEKVVETKPDNLVAEEIAIGKIHTDTKRFQNRMDAFSEASANSVAENYDPNKFDPIVVWLDPKAKKLFVLSGHSRYEGMKRRNSKTISVRYFKGTEQEAIQFAKVEANRGATQETLIEDLAAYRLMRDGDDSRGIKKSTKGELQKIFKGKVQKLEAYSYLAPGGLFVNALSQATTSNYPYLERNAQWIGQLRKENAVLQNSSEDNIFHFFYSDKTGKHLKLSKDEFFKLAQKRINQLGKNEHILFSECSSDGCVKINEKESDPVKGDAYKRLREVNETLASINEKLKSNDPKIRVTTQAERDYLIKELAPKLQAEKENIQNELNMTDKQESLFGLNGHPDPRKVRIAPCYLKNHPDFAKQIIKEFDELYEKEPGPGGGGTFPKNHKPLVVREPVLWDNAANAKRVGPNSQWARSFKELKREWPTMTKKYYLEKRKKYFLDGIPDRVFVVDEEGNAEITEPKAKTFVQDIPRDLAERSFYWTSFNPERRGQSAREEYATTLQNFIDDIRPRAAKVNRLDEFEEDFARFRNKLADLTKSWLYSHSRVASSMITGPAKFPTEKNRKRSDAADKKLNEVVAYEKKILKLLKNKYRPEEEKPVRTGADNANDLLKKKLTKAEELQKFMVDVNKIIRSKKDVEQKLKDYGVKDALIRELLKPSWNGRVGFAAYQLQNNNQEIARLKKRLADEEKLSTAREGGNQEGLFTGGKIVRNYDMNRVQLFFDGKPNEARRALLKSRGFKWAPSVGAWQRQLNTTPDWLIEKVTDPEGLGAMKPRKQAEMFTDVKRSNKPVDELLQERALQDAIRAGSTVKVGKASKTRHKGYTDTPLFASKAKEAQTSLFGARRGGVVRADQLAGLTFKEIPLDGEWKLEFNKLMSDTQVMIWGVPGSGKTVKLLKFAQYLAEKGLPTLYVANEEFGRSSFTEKIREFRIGHTNLFFAKDLPEDMDGYQVIFLDSVQSLGMDLAAYKEFRQAYPNKLTIAIIQSTKDGDFRGGKDWEHEVDIAGEVVSRKMLMHKNRLDPDHASKAEKIQIEHLVKEKTKSAKIKETVKQKIQTQQTA